MNMNQQSLGNAAFTRRAYTLTEVAVAVALTGLLMFSLYAGFSSGFAMLKLAREDLRATQILVQRMETIRLYTWTEVNNALYVPPNFTERYDPRAPSGSGEVFYSGKLTVANPPAGSLPDSYRTNMRLVTATVYWTNMLGTNRVVRSRQAQTYVARYGMQNYIYN